jgi:hypothetical protein
MTMATATLPALPLDQIDAMLETVRKFLPIANNFLPAEVQKFEGALPIIELDLKLASAMQANTDPAQVNAVLAAQMRAMADKLDPPHA